MTTKNKIIIDEDTISVYNDREIEYLDKYLPLVNHILDVINILEF